MYRSFTQRVAVHWKRLPMEAVTAVDRGQEVSGQCSWVHGVTLGNGALWDEEVNLLIFVSLFPTQKSL